MASQSIDGTSYHYSQLQMFHTKARSSNVNNVLVFGMGNDWHTERKGLAYATSNVGTVGSWRPAHRLKTPHNIHLEELARSGFMHWLCIA